MNKYLPDAMSYEQLKHELEKIVDARGLRMLLVILADICADKETYLQTERSAENWRKAEKMIDRCANNLPQLTHQGSTYHVRTL